MPFARSASQQSRKLSPLATARLTAISLPSGSTAIPFAFLKGASADHGDLTMIVHRPAPPKKKVADPVPPVKTNSTSLLAMKKKQDAKASTKKKFVVEERVSDIRFSPDDTHLAVASRDNCIYIFNVTDNYRRVGVLRGHTSYITHIDWSADGHFLQTTSGDYELLYWQAPTRTNFEKAHDCWLAATAPSCSWRRERRWEQSRDMTDLADYSWHTWTCTLGYPVMGIWPPYSDGTDVNAVDRSSDGKLIVSAEDTFHVALFRNPCLKGAERKVFRGHMSHVMRVKFTAADDDFVVSVGGLDCCAFQWKRKRAAADENDAEQQEMDNLAEATNTSAGAIPMEVEPPRIAQLRRWQ